MLILRAALCAAALLVAAGITGTPAAAQTEEEIQRLIQERTGQQMSQDEIIRRLEQSGMTRAQVRSRLSQRGLDPSLADPYFDRLEGDSVAELPALTDPFAQALGSLGLLGQMGDSLFMQDSLAVDSLGPRPDSLGPDSIPIFGKAVFARRTSEFDPVLGGPVPSDYRLGPGDVLELVLTGDVELAYSLPVSREGSIVIPDVGQVLVNGLTMQELEDRLYDRLGRVYSGVTRGPNATTRFQVSLGRLRANEVYVIGEVEYPGAYRISSLGTVLGALYQAGGPNDHGSFRRIQVRRRGQTVEEIDLYSYLLGGDTRGDIRLQQGDVVFVPLADRRVTVLGAVPRNAIFQVLADEGLRDLMYFAGGGAPDADVERVRIERTVPPEERANGRFRVLTDVDLVALRRLDQNYPLMDGDLVRVDSLGDERRDVVKIRGSVYRPGDFQLASGMTVGDAIRRAGGLRPEAFRPVAHVTRLIEADSTYRMVRVSLTGSDPDLPGLDLPLQDQDSVRIFGEAELRTPRTVRIRGEVKAPDEYLLAGGMTVEDLILTAGGFTEEAQGLEVEVARLQPTVDRTDTITARYRVALQGTVPWDVMGRSIGAGLTASPPPGLPDASEFELLEGDQVFVRPLPGFSRPGAVSLSGEVQLPGPYAFNIREERLSSFLSRAGGVTDEAYLSGARLLRDSLLVAVDFNRALESPGSAADPVLRPGDELIVPDYEGTVLVRGAVAFETRVLYRDDMDLDDYLSQAGGTLHNADEGRISVEYPNGTRETVGGGFLFFDSKPEVLPGSTIDVPVEPEGAGTDWSGVVTTTVSILSTTATLILAISRIN